VNWKNVRDAAAWAHEVGDPAVAGGVALTGPVPAGVTLGAALGVALGVAIAEAELGVAVPAEAVPAAMLDDATAMVVGEPAAPRDEAVHPVASSATESPANRDSTRTSPIINVLSRLCGLPFRTV